MTREEFAKGWAFLTTQPWGRLYDGRLEPEKAQIQFELYYTRLGFANYEAWKDTAMLFAAGTDWPALTEIRHSLSQRNKTYVKALPAPVAAGEIGTEAQRKAEATLTRILGRPFTFPVSR